MKYFRYLIYSITGICAYSFLLYSSIKYAYRERSFKEVDQVVDITYRELPNAFFDEISKLNYGYANRLLSLAREKKCGLKRIGNAVLLIDEYSRYAFLAGKDIDERSLRRIGKYCDSNQLSVFCDPKYNLALVSIKKIKDPSILLDNKIVFECEQQYPEEVNFGLKGLVNVKIAPIKEREFASTIQASLMSYLYGTPRYSAGFLQDGEGYVLKTDNRILAEIYILTGSKSEWRKLGGKFFKDDRRAEIYIYVNNDFIRRGLGAAISKYVINLVKKKNPDLKLYWVCDKTNLASERLARKLNLKQKAALNRIRYTRSNSDGETHNLIDAHQHLKNNMEIDINNS